MNKAQLAYMTRNGLADMAALHAASPAVRLGWANLAGTVDPEPEDAPASKLTAAAKDFLAGRAVDALNAGDREMYEYLNTSPHFVDKVTVAAADLAQSIEPPKSRAIPALDPAKLASLSGPAKLGVSNDFAMLQEVRSGRFSGDVDAIMVRLSPYLQSAA